MELLYEYVCDIKRCQSAIGHYELSIIQVLN